MKRLSILLVLGVILVPVLASADSSVLPAFPPLINYQGMLTDAGGTPIDGARNLTFRIYDDTTGGGTLQWSETQNGVQVDHGLFNVVLGKSTALNLAFDKSYWLEVEVEGNVMPRIRFTSVGYAYRAQWSDTANYARSSGGGSGSPWIFRITDGNDTTITTGGQWGMARSGNVLYGNADSTHINLGVACTTGVNGVDKKYCTVLGGRGNYAPGDGATVLGGEYNKALHNYATVVGGQYNYVGTMWSTVVGGLGNFAGSGLGSYATVGGGGCDTAAGRGATVPGGEKNVARGDYSFAAGYRAKSRNHGTFVWADSTNADFASTDDNQFLIRAAGGVGIGTTSPNEELSVDGAIAIQQSDVPKYHMDYYGGGLNFSETGVADYRLFIQDGGEVGIGTSGPTEKLDVNGSARLRSMTTGTGTTVIVDETGVLKKLSSSKRYKDNIRELEVDQEKVLQLKPVRFDWKTTGEPDIGLIAEEVEKAIPDLVIYDGEGKPDAVKYDKISLYLLRLVKELKAENEELQKRIEILERR